jgi:hypothetical protein
MSFELLCLLMFVFASQLCWNFKTICGARNRVGVVVPARQATYAGGIDSLESIPGRL